MAVRTRGLNHIHLIVRDLDRSLRFYRGAFGLEERFRDGPKMVFLSPPGSDHLITLNEDAESAHLAGDNGGVGHFGLGLADPAELDRAIAEVERNGGKLLQRGERGESSRYAYVADPDGYVIEI